MDPRREGRFTVSEKISLVRFSAVELGAGAGPGGGNRCGPGGCGKAWLDCFRKRPLCLPLTLLGSEAAGSLPAFEPATDTAAGWLGASSILSTLLPSALASTGRGSISWSDLLTGGVGKVADLGIRLDFLNGEVPRKLVRPLESRLCLDAREVDDPETLVGTPCSWGGGGGEGGGPRGLRGWTLKRPPKLLLFGGGLLCSCSFGLGTELS